MGVPLHVCAVNHRPERQHAAVQGGANAVLLGASHDIVSINIGAKDEQQALQCAPCIADCYTAWLKSMVPVT